MFSWWQFCIVQMLSSLKTFLHISFVFFRSLIGNFLSSFSFFFAFSHSLIGNFLVFSFFSFFVFFREQGWTFSPWVKVYGKLGFWLKACRTVGHDICQGVGLASGSGIKGMYHIISMTHTQRWWFGNFMQNWSCTHPCGHSSIKFLWSCDTRAQDSFFLFKSTQCFQNMFFYQFMHSSKSILGVRENFRSIQPSGAYTFFFQKLVMISESFFQRKAGSYFFSKMCWLFSRKIYFLSPLFVSLFKLLSFVYFLFFSFSLWTSRADKGAHYLFTPNHKVNEKNT